MPRTITFQPSNELGDFVESMVQTGSYNNQSEVIRDALRQLQEKTANSKLAKLRELIDEGEDSGDPIEWSAGDFLARMKKRAHD